MTSRQAGQRGQATVLALVAIVFAGLLAAGVAHLGNVVAHRAAAQAAADAVALAGASGGAVEAGEAATANRADLVAYRTEGLEVVVTVERSGERATARARWLPAPIP